MSELLQCTVCINREMVTRETHAWTYDGGSKPIVGFHVTSEKTKIKVFKFLPLPGKSQF